MFQSLSVVSKTLKPIVKALSVFPLLFFRLLSQCLSICSLSPTLSLIIIISPIFSPFSHTFTHISAGCNEPRDCPYEYLPTVNYQGQSAEICSLPPFFHAYACVCLWAFDCMSASVYVCVLFFSALTLLQAGSGIWIKPQSNLCYQKCQHLSHVQSLTYFRFICNVFELILNSFSISMGF